ncbi:hypothetical protein CcaverHIS002_0301800 [Cutaneotrichosporon cavernicola]|uniref:Uncharacterized protein n=1 Tax=Cutaneotrichosporon cavernicola TaxID=279322 RepID=A0AA48I5N7_9TREE|nr:uncharacterized protein CcaverHIS019_0301740 [Cutaneotrichosporon cavernicola]BEI82312.1 hypothetical protein CcaverHIS002_0301800 [Cutaneotrichosporon cavernicola]BEI90104.1 hypothetical protein CcaverHIS019_0301740 [Cutaneotrichosporon cavernicola]BEI97882.1 hypothetical protein CcaverHIS631_0301810 [Cutaneotrichosporon cavernicola]BEJ05660.1 hypothetical protein CcaverHIS641_0301820 [Cutaneotrichosporon cavernicola]
MLALSILILAGLAIATPYPIVLDAFASGISYIPNSPGVARNVWNATFTDTPWTSWVNGTDNVGWGLGYRIVRMDEFAPPSNSTASNSTTTERYKCAGDCPARAEFNFYGTGIEFWGFWGAPGSVQEQGGAAVLDIWNNTVMQSSGSVNGEYDSKVPIKLGEAKVMLGNHTLALVPQWGNVALTHMVVYMELDGSTEAIASSEAHANILNLALPTNTSEPHPFAEKNPAIPMVLEQNWVPGNAVGWDSKQPNKNYTRMGTWESNARLSLSIPKGNRFLRVNGTSGWNHGTFRVDITPPPPGRIETEYHYTSVSWNTPNTTFYVAALDPKRSYDVAFTNLGSIGGDSTYLWFDIHAFELWPVGPDEGRVSKSVVVGAAVGGSLGFILVLAAAYILWRWRNKKKAVAAQSPEDPKPDTLTATDAGTVLPYFPPSYDEGWTANAASSSAVAAPVASPVAAPVVAPVTGSTLSTASQYEDYREMIKTAAYRGAVSRET